MKNNIQEISQCLEQGNVLAALYQLYAVCQTDARDHLPEVIRQSVRLREISARSGRRLISQEDKQKVEQQVIREIREMLDRLSKEQLAQKNDVEDNQMSPEEVSVRFRKVAENLENKEAVIKRLKRELELAQIKSHRVKKEHIAKPIIQIVRPDVDKGAHNRKIRLDIVGLSSSHSQIGHYALVLGESEGNRRLSIIIGGAEAQAIALELENIKPNRPATHDLMYNCFRKFNMDMWEVIIDLLKDGVFYSKLICKLAGETTEIDATPANATAICVRFKVPIYTYERVISEAGIVIDEDSS